MRYFDDHPDVLEWASEETIIPYFDPVAQRQRRYFMDFYLKCRTRDGRILAYLVEVKPEKQTKPPSKRSGRQDNYLRELATYATNQAKWEAATAACRSRGWQFLILTEKHLRTH